VTWGSEAVVAAKKATSVIPIVFAASGDPIGTARKRLELLREVVPGLRRLAIMFNVDAPVSVLDMREVQAAADTLGLDVALSEIRQTKDIASAFDRLKGRADALYVCTEPLVFTNRVRINILAAAARLPTMHGRREYIEAGGLISYGTNFPDLFRRAGDYVDKILRGASPGDLPVEQPTKFDLVISLITAQALGLDVPPQLLAPRRRGHRITAHLCTSFAASAHVR
jgi:ABC-type uncharacterized transport system substrate-binding protein